ncbi:AlbA family DNA-binding domain-containing protein [Bradyrhizobium vignae]|uniref:AlbA family DNA-binding domain-containing protein n=1 Tax=Bradyrhizobium vignae TaxID=1549949 RepID=UPI0013E8EC13|nr:ATP-binding protein [Bradyrhizobium vignae]
MRDAKDWDEAYLLELIAVGEQESLTLDYKASADLAKDNSKRNAVSKDVSAFANSAGGFIVYGILENKHVPTSIDVGVGRNILTKEWLESIIKSVIQPVVDAVAIKSIDIQGRGDDKVVYVVQIPQSTSRAPHQAFDHRYYKRFNFESAPMEDYEVRDLMRRSIEYGRKYGAAWDPNVEINRLITSINERGQIDGSAYLPRDRLMISVSSSLRSAGSTLALLPKPLRKEMSHLLREVDEFNSIIETTDPGQRDQARLNENRKKDLVTMFQIGLQISSALEQLLDVEP